jgi:hypothetical protein
MGAPPQEAYRGRTRLGTRITEDAGVSLRCMSPLLAHVFRHPYRRVRKLSGDKLPSLGTAHDG